MTRMAKIFTNGRSQAVRLPADFRFDTREVFIRQDPDSGDIILSRRPGDWDSFLQAIASTSIPDDFLSAEERALPPEDRDPFGDTKT